MQGTKVKQTSKGGFVVGSCWVDEGLNASMHYLDPNGNTLSTKLFGGNNNVQLFDMDITSNDYVVLQDIQRDTRLKIGIALSC